MNSPLLKVEDLCLSFIKNTQETKVLNRLSFTVEKGESIGIVGESGSGKSALAKALTYLHHPEQTKITGKILFDAHSILEANEKELRYIRKKKIGYVFQDPLSYLNPNLSVGFQLREVNPNQNEILEILNLLGILSAKEILSYYPHMLSGGQRQRILIAMAIAKQPELLIADEPTTALDVTVQKQLLTLLKQIKTRLNMTFILITHDFRLVSSLCDRVFVMYAGEIVEMATTLEIFHSPKHPYTQKLLKCIPDINNPLDRKLTPLKGSPPSFEEHSIGCRFAPRCEHAMHVCVTKKPSLYQIGSSKAACFLYAKEEP